MDYQMIKLSLADLYQYLLGIDDSLYESKEAKEIITDLLSFLTSLHLDFQLETYRYKNEMMIMNEVSDGLFEILEDYEDLDDQEFTKHIKEYQVIQQINSRIISYFNDDPILYN